VVATLFVLTATLALPTSEDTKAPAVGATVPNFTLKDAHRRPRSPDDYKDAMAFVVVFLDTECPVSNLYIPTLIDLHKRYAGKGVQILAINASNQDSFVMVAAHAQERDLPFPVLKDFDQGVLDSFGAKRTPEAFLLDAKRVIRYHGRIDDQYAVGVRRDKPTRSDLKEAIDELLAGKAVSTPETTTSGCVVERAKKPAVEGEVTFTKDVAPLLQKHCQECHRPGEIGPFSLLSYDDAKARAKRIREAIQEQRMPPWHADPRFGKFANDRRMTPEERDTLLAWIDKGAARGDEKDPPPVKFVKGWKIGEPDKVFTMDKEFTVPASGVLDYQRFVIDPGLKEDVWIQASEARPGNRAVVHHILVYVLAPGKSMPYDNDGTAHTLAGWAPGDMPAIYPPGTARRVKAGSRLMFEVHYTPNGTEQTDRSSVGVIFAKKPPEHVAETNILANLSLRIPPGAPNHKGQMVFTFPEDALVLSFMPHMHLRGTSAKYVATYPDGKTETLLSVPDYDFNWQSVYRFEKPVHIPKGTKLTWTGAWDNSPDNPRNPDPKAEVRWGLQTFDEMQNGWMDVVWLKKK
jgi:peroxiredoxin/mono/diheme cytochrome c family protein